MDAQVVSEMAVGASGNASGIVETSGSGFGYSGFGQTVSGVPIWWLAMNCGQFSLENSFRYVNGHGEGSYVLSARAYLPDGKPESGLEPLSDSVLYQNFSGVPFIGPSAETNSPLYVVGVKKGENGGETFVKAEFLGFYNGQPAYELTGRTAAGNKVTIFYSAFRKRFVLHDEFREPVAYRKVMYYPKDDGSDYSSESGMDYVEEWYGDSWYEGGTVPVDCLGEPAVYKAAGVFLNDEAAKDDEIYITVYMVLFKSKEGGLGGEYEDSSEADCDALRSAHEGMPGTLNLGGMWSWSYNGMLYSMDPGNCVGSGPDRTEVYTRSGGAIHCPGGLWLFARTDCGGWVVNIRGRGAERMSNVVREGSDLVAEFKTNVELNRLFEGEDWFDPGDELLECGERQEDIVLRWSLHGGGPQTHKRLGRPSVALVDAAAL